MKEKIVKWYNQGLWTKPMVKNAVKKGVLTADDYTEIVGEALNKTEPDNDNIISFI